MIRPRAVAGMIAGALVAGMIAGRSLGASAAAPARSSYVDATYGFELPVPSAPPATAASTMVAQFLLPPRDGFAPNVNVQVQRIAGGLAAFRKESEAQFAALGAEIVKIGERRVGKAPALELAYRTTMNGRRLVHLALAVERGTEIFLVTCTATEADLAADEASFRRTLAGFSLTR